jgi:large subunit ribosomal protein L15
MMSITDYLVLPKGASKNRKRRGRGQGSGHGGTSCRGHKGQQARGMTKRTKGFEGGQMPLLRRIPKRGFTNIFKKQYQIVNIERLKEISEEASITPALLREKGLIKNETIPVKILGEGKLEKKAEVHAHAFSKKARQAIESLGGKAIVIKKKVKE